MQKKAWDSLSQLELVQMIRIGNGYCMKVNDPEDFLNVNGRYEAIVFYDGGRIIGFALVTPNYCRNRECVCVEGMCYGWMDNTEERITQMISAVARIYSGEAKKYIVLNAQKRREMNYELYTKIGFRNTILPSPAGREYCILYDTIEHLSSLFHE